MSGRKDLKRLFEMNPNKWIPCFQVAEVAGLQYNARIKELREDPDNPMIIENRWQHINGKRHSWFRYVMPEKSGQLIFV
jgi:hypothetical protein